MRTIITFLTIIFIAQTSYASDISISNSWVAASLGKSPMGVAYLTISNQSKDKLILEKVTGNVSEAIEIHTHMKSDDGMMQMRKVENVAIMAGEKAVFEPGGLHLMLIGLKHPLKAGESVDLTLHFANGETIATTFEVKQR